MNNPMTYIQNGDYLIPDLNLSHQPEKPLGKYGRMRKTYLKEHRPILYNQMLLSEKLYQHLLEIDETAQSRLEQMMPQLAKEAGATEELKASDPDVYKRQFLPFLREKKQCWSWWPCVCCAPWPSPISIRKPL